MVQTEIRQKKVYGYCRVSTKEQNLDRQLIAMKEENVPDENVYCDKQSGKDFERKNFKKLVRKLKSGDTLVIMSIDRLGRDYDAIGQMWRHLVLEKNVCIKVLDMPILTTTDNSLINRLLSDIILQLLAYVAQTERENLLKRQAQGIEAARARGVQFGRPKIEVCDDFKQIVIDYKMHKYTLKEAVAKSGMSQRTFYRRSNELWAEIGSEYELCEGV